MKFQREVNENMRLWQKYIPLDRKIRKFA